MNGAIDNKLVDLGIVLPVGLQLKPLISHPDVSTAFLKKILRERGVLCVSEERKDILVCFFQIILTPQEFKLILHQIKTREESLKERDEAVELNDPNIELSSIANDNYMNLIDIGEDPYGNYSIVGAPAFTVVDEGIGVQKAVINYTLERRSLDSDYIQARRKFKANIELVRTKGEAQVTIVSRHSCLETKVINNKAIKQFKKTAKKKGLVKRAPSQSITFGCFTNAERIHFLLGCLNCSGHSDFGFDKITDLDLKPDSSLDLSKQDKLSWIKDKVSAIRLKGKALEDTFFVTDIDCHEYILIWRIQCQFQFSNKFGKGFFRVTLDFDNYARKANSRSRFQLSITEIKFDSDFSNESSEAELNKKFAARLHEAKEAVYKEIMGAKKV